MSKIQSTKEKHEEKLLSCIDILYFKNNPAYIDLWRSYYREFKEPQVLFLMYYKQISTYYHWIYIEMSQYFIKKKQPQISTFILEEAIKNKVYDIERLKEALTLVPAFEKKYSKGDMLAVLNVKNIKCLGKTWNKHCEELFYLKNLPAEYPTFEQMTIIKYETSFRNSLGNGYNNNDLKDESFEKLVENELQIDFADDKKQKKVNGLDRTVVKEELKLMTPLDTHNLPVANAVQTTMPVNSSLVVDHLINSGNIAHSVSQCNDSLYSLNNQSGVGQAVDTPRKTCKENAENMKDVYYKDNASSNNLSVVYSPFKKALENVTEGSEKEYNNNVKAQKTRISNTHVVVQENCNDSGNKSDVNHPIMSLSNTLNGRCEQDTSFKSDGICCLGNSLVLDPHINMQSNASLPLQQQLSYCAQDNNDTSILSATLQKKQKLSDQWLCNIFEPSAYEIQGSLEHGCELKINGYIYFVQSVEKNGYNLLRIAKVDDITQTMMGQSFMLIKSDSKSMRLAKDIFNYEICQQSSSFYILYSFLPICMLDSFINDCNVHVKAFYLKKIIEKLIIVKENGVMIKDLDFFIDQDFDVGFGSFIIDDVSIDTTISLLNEKFKDFDIAISFAFLSHIQSLITTAEAKREILKHKTQILQSL